MTDDEMGRGAPPAGTAPGGLAPYAGTLLIVKLGGAAVDAPGAAAGLFRQVRALSEAGVRVVVVHGGGARVTALAARLGAETRFVAGRRVTDEAALECAKLALAGGVATDLAASARRAGVAAVPVSGVAGGLLVAVRRPPTPAVDYGLVGDLVRVEPRLLIVLTAAGFVPLVASLAADAEGAVLNVNADTVACALAAALPGCRLLILTDTDGVLRDVADPGSRIPRLRAAELGALAATGGMLPKLAAIAACLAAGTAAVHVASWRRPDALTACLAGRDAVGTRIE